jgi:hypothetical protein
MSLARPDLQEAYFVGRTRIARLASRAGRQGPPRAAPGYGTAEPLDEVLAPGHFQLPRARLGPADTGCCAYTGQARRPGSWNKKPAKVSSGRGQRPRVREGVAAGSLKRIFRSSGNFSGTDSNFPKVDQFTRCHLCTPNVTWSQASAAQRFFASSAIQTRDPVYQMGKPGIPPAGTLAPEFSESPGFSDAGKSRIEVRPPRP